MIDLIALPLIETDWLATHLDAPELRIVDARWRGDGTGRQRYLAGHIPGAIHLDWHLDLNETRDGLRDMLLPPEEFAELMSRSGIGDETRVVAYVETDHSGAARLWWALRYYGHEQVAVVNGGITKWMAEGLPLSVEVPQPQPTRFTARPQPHWGATAEEVERVLSNRGRSTCLVDSRPPEQYEGRAVWTPNGSLYLAPGQEWIDNQGRKMRAGHIPGAVHQHSVLNLDHTDWTYLDPEALRARAQAAGIRPEQRLITYCGVGISASLELFSLYLAGYRNLALYDGSWEEWGTDPARPVEKKIPGNKE